MSTLAVVLLVVGIVETIGLLWGVCMARSAHIGDAALEDRGEFPRLVAAEREDSIPLNVAPLVRTSSGSGRTAAS